MTHYFNSRDIKCKKPFGAVATGEEVAMTVYAENGIYIHNVYFVLIKDGGLPVYFQMRFDSFSGKDSVFKVSFKISDAGLYHYHFMVINERRALKLMRGKNGFAAENTGDNFVLYAYDNKYKTPDWIKGGVIYHIFIDRFKRGVDPDAVFIKDGVLKKWGEPVTIKDADGIFRANDFYGGNFQGIIDKLDYLEELGVTLIYLSPIFKSASNHRYDTGDYLQLDELLGTEEKFKELIALAEKHNISIMLDGVFNHTGADSLYFNKFGNYPEIGAYQSKDSKYFDWFLFDEFPDHYRCWWGVTVSPTVNKQNKKFRKLILGKGGVIDKYTKMGVKGWRLDVVDELDVDFVDDIRTAVKKYDKNSLLIGEVWEDASTKISYEIRRPYFSGKQLDGVMNYPFKNAIFNYTLCGDLDSFTESVMQIVENYPKQALDASMNIVGTHDTWRLLNSCAGIDVCSLDKEERNNIKFDEKTIKRAIERLKIAVALEFFLPGVPSIYYGDEAGVNGYDDPLCRKPMPWGNFNGEIFGFYRKITKIRKDWRPLFTGTLNFISSDVFLIAERKFKGKSIFLIINNTDQKQHFHMDRTAVELITNVEHPAGVHLMPPRHLYILDR